MNTCNCIENTLLKIKPSFFCLDNNQILRLFRYEPYLVYQIVFYSLFFFAPTIGILIVSILIGVAVMTRTPKMGTQKKKKQILAVTQLVLIVMSFLIGYIPFTGEIKELF